MALEMLAFGLLPPPPLLQPWLGVAPLGPGSGSGSVGSSAEPPFPPEPVGPSPPVPPVPPVPSGSGVVGVGAGVGIVEGLGAPPAPGVGLVGVGVGAAVGVGAGVGAGAGVVPGGTVPVGELVGEELVAGLDGFPGAGELAPLVGSPPAPPLPSGELLASVVDSSPHAASRLESRRVVYRALMRMAFLFPTVGESGRAVSANAESRAESSRRMRMSLKLSGLVC